MDGNNCEYKFRCCFCNKKIKSNKTDPADVNVLINIDKPEDRQCNQNFFCHTECFRLKIHPDIKIHFHLHNIMD